MKSFRIPLSQMELTTDAFAAVIMVDSIEKGEEFLDNYGSHVSTGRQEVRSSYTAPDFAYTACFIIYSVYTLKAP